MISLCDDFGPVLLRCGFSPLPSCGLSFSGSRQYIHGAFLRKRALTAGRPKTGWPPTAQPCRPQRVIIGGHNRFGFCHMRTLQTLPDRRGRGHAELLADNRVEQRVKAIRTVAQRQRASGRESKRKSGFALCQPLGPFSQNVISHYLFLCSQNKASQEPSVNIGQTGLPWASNQPTDGQCGQRHLILWPNATSLFWFSPTRF